ncbi:MAG: sulfur carrier protein ThiS [Bacteriovoracaceae bacterium]|nr:sulfur carrier protein ThiS [Bacteriovoracaceae bacterium]
MIIVNNRDKLEWKNGMTVRDVLSAMGHVYPLITVTVNEELVEEEDYDTRKVPDNSSISVFHLAHGG